MQDSSGQPSTHLLSWQPTSTTVGSATRELKTTKKAHYFLFTLLKMAIASSCGTSDTPCLQGHFRASLLLY